MQDKLKLQIMRLLMFIFKKFIRNMQYATYNLYDGKNILKVDWVQRENFGDILNPVLVQRLTGKKILHVVPAYYSNQYYSVIGSILDRAGRNTVVWGSGFISGDSKVKSLPLKIAAVRGPKTRELLISDGIECPAIYGDPALLLPKVYSPDIKKQYKLGIIPHYVDKNNKWLKQFEGRDDVKIIDVEVADPFDFINELLMCEKIISSSLHGIIVADAYEIPSIWVEFSQKVIGSGFKFIDYFLSVGREDKQPCQIDASITLNDVYAKFYDYKINIDLSALLSSAPFEIKKEFHDS